MTAPAPNGQFTIFHLLALVGLGLGAILGAKWGYAALGVGGAVLGALVGGPVGFVALGLGLVLLSAGVLAGFAWVHSGRAAARQVFRGRRDEPPAGSTTSGG